MARNHLESLQKQRVKLDKRITTAITVGGWLVLVMLLVLVWHLFAVTRPILSKPFVEYRHSWQLPAQHQFLHATKVNNSYLYFWQDERCEIGFSDFPPDAILSTSERVGFSPDVEMQDANTHSNGCVTSPKGYKQKIHSQKEAIYIAELNEQHILRISLLDFAKAEIKTQIFSARIPVNISLPDEPDFNQHWQFHITQESVLLLFDSGESGWHLLQFDMDSRELLHSEALTLSNHFSDVGGPTLVANEELIALYHGNEFRLLTPDYGGLQPDNWSITTRDSAILKAISLPTQRSFLLLNETLQLEKWSLLNVAGEMRLQHIYTLELDGHRFHSLSHVDKDLVIVAVDNQVFYINATTGEISTSETHNLSTRHIVTGKDIYFQNQKNITHWQVQNTSAVISTKSLWGSIWYDGYPTPDFVWQTSSATDEHQAKYSLVPLIMGSIKAAFLALIVAIPLAIGSAIYCAFFAGPKLRKLIKPWVETLEAVPSVVIGFVAAIWLLPVSENYIIGLFLFILLLPFMLFAFIWLNDNYKHKDVKGWELLFFGTIAAFYLFAFEQFLAGGNLVVDWLWGGQQSALLSTELKHTFVLGLALGIAIVPAIFTIAEDAIYQVPKKLTMASYAMGATKAQTLTKVVLKVALPGIFSAVMLGFARAIGETMIVLMVSGNTPVAQWDLLEGMRTMTANLAIELPEAQPGDVHYQILFLVALLLFGFTFVVNTLAEFLRLRLREQYRL